MRVSKTLILLSFFLIAVIWCGMANKGLSAVSEKVYTESGVNHALIIGIGDYDKWNKLESPSKDAKEVYRIFTEKYNFKKQNVTLLNDDSKEDPSLLNIITHLDNYLNDLTEKDNLVIFYSGHSKEDEEGETYWIPKEANKRLKQTWLSHSDICNEYIGSEDFKAKNVVIITDSVFSKKLLKSSSNTLDLDDRRYTDKAKEKASKRSREVISFGDKHFAGGDKYEGYGLFTYYLRKSLTDNWFEVIDFENLIFNDEEMILQVRKIAGTRLLRGRLKNSTMDEKGVAIIARVISPPPIIVTDAYVTPEKDYAGEEFRIDAVTNRSAMDVYVELGGRQYPMDGEGTEWKRTIKVASIGKSSFRIFAFNEDDVEGDSIKKELETIEPVEGMVSVTDAQVNPKQGEGGDEFTFTAKTDSSAKKVTLLIGDKRYNMTGSGTNWTLKRKIEQSGNVAFSMIAVNENGIEGRAKSGGAIAIKAPRINIVSLKPPEPGYAGDEFLFTVKTDFPARSVELKLGNRTYEMEGSEKDWQLKQKISDIGKLSFTVAAINTEGISGDSKGGEISTTERPADIPDIASVTPGKAFAGVDITIRVKTSADAKEVTLELDGKSMAMEGSGTDWRYPTQIASVGTSSYKVFARNKDNQQGNAREGTITITEKVGVDVAQAEVSPKKGNMGDTFTFTATTAEPARSVTAVIGEKKYPMTGSGTNWTLKQKIEDFGTIDYSIVAMDDKGEEGSPKEGSFVSQALLANVIEATASSPNNFESEEFTFKVNTDNDATSVSLEIDGTPYDMEGSGKEWQFTKTIHDIGTIKYTALAKNIEDNTGTPVSKDLVVKLAIPDVTDDIAFSTDTIYAGEDFSISVKTNTNADQVLINIDGKSEPMTGSGTDWTYTTQIADIGSKSYTVVAKNREGTEGKSKTGTIDAIKKPGALVAVTLADVEPKEGYAGSAFTFTASTDTPALGVTLKIAGKDYPMTGSGTDWTLKQEIEKTGNVPYSIVAINEDNVEGIETTGDFDVKELTERYAKNDDGTITDKVTGEVLKRFVDNGDGTITDLATNLMWQQSPKRLIASYEEAEEYCTDLSKGDYSGWRLPTAKNWNNLIDKNQEAPALPMGHPFKNILISELFWSKTRSGLQIYVADLYTGKIGRQSMSKEYLVWAVRAAE